MKRTCTRKVEFDSAHRVTLHESKCRNLHGHRYTAEITAEAEDLDGVGRVIDFGVLKSLVGGWINRFWDHGAILRDTDVDLIELCRANGWKLFILSGEPTAENLAKDLYETSVTLIREGGYEDLRITHIRLYETPNCWADYPNE